MPRTNYPSDKQDQFIIRMPDGMRDEIKSTAEANNRSMNAEIVARLSGEQRTLRDWFAGQIYPSILASVMAGHAGHKDGESPLGPADFAAAAYEGADALLAARRAKP